VRQLQPYTFRILGFARRASERNAPVSVFAPFLSNCTCAALRIRVHAARRTGTGASLQNAGAVMPMFVCIPNICMLYSV
jgi:hypothetical protein